MDNIKLVAIDFDDTLCMTEEAVFHLENYIAQSMGFDPMTREAHKKNWGVPVEEAIVERIPGIDAVEFMRRHREVLPVFFAEGKMDVINPHNVTTLQTIKDSGKILTIVTSRVLHEVEHLLEPSHELAVFIDGFYHKDRTIYGKPDPRVFDGMLQDFNLQPSEVVYIGDAPTDAIAAKKAGLHFVAVLESGIRSREDFEDIEVVVDHFIEKFTDIEQLLI